MNITVLMGLVNNAALLLALGIIYEISYAIPVRKKTLLKIFNGCLIALIGLAIMAVPYQLTSGVVFDTRSILISVTALTFGTIPTLILVISTGIFRIIQGGAGTYAGLAVIISCAGIGLLWRHYFLNKWTKLRWLNIYIFGVLVHIVMLICMFLLPWPLPIQVLTDISLPIMLIYPLGTLFLSILLLNQRERQQAIEEVKEAEELYRSLFYNNQAIMMLLDPSDGRIMEINKAASNFYGWSIEDMRSRKVTDVNTLSESKVKAEMKKALNEERNHFLFKHRRAKGEPVDVEVYSGPITIKGRRLIYSIIHDISERVASEKSLRESEKRFRMLVDGSPDAIYIETEMSFAFVNKATLDLFGADCEEQLLGKSVIERFHPDCRQEALGRISQLTERKEAVPPLEQIYLSLDGDRVYVDVTAVPIEFRGKHGAMVFVRNITERKKLESTQIEMEAQIRQQQKLEAIGTLAGGVAHEINNPINGIINYAQLILDSTEEESRDNEYAREIIHESERISSIVKNLLQFSRQEKQSHSYVNIKDIINRTTSLVSNNLVKDQVELELYVEEELPEIKCRSQQIQQVIMNLLINAKDALNEKYPGYHDDKIVRLFCTQYLKEDRRWLRITIEDHGNGISEEVREKIFEPFFSTKPKDKGTGLGLSISFGIVKDHHGVLSVESQVGQYTRFHLDLPVDNGWGL